MKYSTTLLAAANIVALAQAAPVDSAVCSLVIVTYTGSPVWVPVADPTTVWPAWTTTSTTAKVADPTTEWPAWTTKSTTAKVPAATTTTTYDPWTAWTTTTSSTTTTTTTPKVVKETTSTYYDPWVVWTSSATTSTPVAATTTPAAATTTTGAATTTAAAPPAAATCPASNGSSVLGGGDCGCSFSVNCDSHADVTQDTKFWERSTGEIILSLAECLSICDSNSECQAAIWVDDSSAGAQDYHRCWQTSGLGGIIGSGYGQISYKGSCSGSCSK